MTELPKVAALYLPDEDDYALAAYDETRGTWFAIKGRPAFDIGPGRIGDLVHASWVARPDAATLREQLAAVEHERWAHWQSYLHSKCEQRDDGSLVIPAGYVAALERQIETPYAGLTETEKDSDREQVDRYWHVLAEHGLVDRDV